MAKNIVEKATFQGDVIRRFLPQDAYEQFIEDYKNHCYIYRKSEITKTDLNIAHDWKKGMTQRELSQKYKMPQSMVESRVRRVAKELLKNSK